MAQLFAIFAIGFYLTSTYHQLMAVAEPKNARRNLVLSLGGVAALLHAATWITPLTDSGELYLNFFNVGSLIALVISCIILIGAVKKPLENLFLGIFPMAALLLLINMYIPNSGINAANWNQGLTIHVTLSILAYSVLTIAAFQAVLLMVQDHQLKHKHMTGIMRALPPLQTMNRLLFEMLRTGTALLTLAIVSGFIFLDDLFAQHLIHKTLFTLIAWTILSFLLFAHWRLGWRGVVASKWTLAAMSFLILAFFGSKLVLEIILEKV